MDDKAAVNSYLRRIMPGVRFKYLGGGSYGRAFAVRVTPLALARLSRLHRKLHNVIMAKSPRLGGRVRGEHAIRVGVYRGSTGTARQPFLEHVLHRPAFQ